MKRTHRHHTSLASAALLLAFGLAGDARANDEPTPCAADESYCTYELPYRSAERIGEIYPAVQRGVLLGLGYSAGAHERCPARLAGSPEVHDVVSFHKAGEKGAIRCLALGLIGAGAGERTRVAIHGTVVTAEGVVTANPDVTAAHARAAAAKTEIDDLAIGAAADRYLTFTLSYVEADRALAMLEQLGYSVVRYAEKTDGGITALQRVSDVSGLRRPVVVEMIGSKQTSLVAKPQGVGGDTNQTLVGGSRLDQVTSGGPEQRLLIVYDRDEKQRVLELVDLLSEKIDVPSRQVLFEALIIEVNRDRLKDLGVSFDGSKDGQSFGFDATASDPFTATFVRPSLKSVLDLSVSLKAVVDEGEGTVISRPSVLVLDGRQARIKIADEVPYLKIIQGDNGIGDDGNLLYSTSYLTAGIILNLRPRTNHDGSEITTQVETIISSAGPAGVTPQGLPIAPRVQSREVQTFVRVANDTPFIIGGLLSQDRQRQTTGIPWLSKIPGLGALFRKRSRIDDRREVLVMITPHVIEPKDRSFAYAIGRDSELFDTFDGRRPGDWLRGALLPHRDLVDEPILFRNVYRLRSGDVLDLDFITEGAKLELLRQTAERRAIDLVQGGSPTVPRVDRREILDFLRSCYQRSPPATEAAAYKALSTPGRSSSQAYLGKSDYQAVPDAATSEVDPVETFLRVLEGGVPGEEILTARMLLRTLEDERFAHFVDQVRDVHYFEEQRELELRRLDRKAPPSGPCDPRTQPTCTYILQIESVIGGLGEFSPPVVTLTVDTVEDADFLDTLKAGNRVDHDTLKQTILLNNSFRADTPESPWQRLRLILMMKRLLDINDRDDLMTLRGFHVGRELIVPTTEELRDREHLVDRQTASLFYESYRYYALFEERFERLAKELSDFLKQNPTCFD